MRTRSPGCSSAGATSCCSFTNVPFVDPRSSTYQRRAAREDPRVLLAGVGVFHPELALRRPADRGGRVERHAPWASRRLPCGPAACWSRGRRRRSPDCARRRDDRARAVDREAPHHPARRAPQEEEEQGEQPVLQQRERERLDAGAEHARQPPRYSISVVPIDDPVAVGEGARLHLPPVQLRAVRGPEVGEVALAAVAAGPARAGGRRRCRPGRRRTRAVARS